MTGSCSPRTLARLAGLLLIVAATTGQAIAAEPTTSSSRFALRTLRSEAAPNASASGRYAVVAQAQSRLAPAAGKRFALLGAAQCAAGTPTPGRVFADGFE
jgi:hypothetical protein